MVTKANRTLKIAVDAMGGDFAPINEVTGSINAYKNKDSSLDLEIILVGDEKKIRSAMLQNEYSDFKYSIVHADDVVTMNDDPTAVIKKKKNSSLYKGLELHSQGYADAFVSAGNTGAVLSTATVLLGRIKGISRPTIGQLFPTQTNTPTFVVDVGANIDSKPRFLFEFAIMANIYVNQMLGLENPRIGLLNIGEESSKGTDVILQTYALLKDSQLNFIGNEIGRASCRERV